MANENAPTAQDYEAAFADFTAAYARLAAVVRADPDASQAFTYATELGDGVLRELVNSARELRAQTAHRIWKAEELSLAALGKRIGVSKARAKEIVDSLKEPKEDPNV